MQDGDVIASVDLGSNSFHMLVARVEAGQLQVIDRMKEMVRLAGGLDEHGYLSQESIERGLECLRRFGQRLAGMRRGRVRIVGTNTLRAAKNGSTFIRRAQHAIGHPIEIIGGREEARLVYLGVAHSDVPVDGRRLVVDIGGGSTELIIGERFEPVRMESAPIGCVRLTADHFSDGKYDKTELLKAERRAELELMSYQRAYREMGWERAVGSSGTARSLAAVAEANGWGDGGLTLKGLDAIRDAVLKAGKLGKLSLDGLSEDRKPVFVGGLVAMRAVFEALGIERMDISDGALREGLIYDWVERQGFDDIRDLTVSRLQRMFNVDATHADRVAQTAATLWEQVEPAWGASGDESSEALPLSAWLDVAARLHEVGLAISHSGYHHHGAYVLQHADMPGLTRLAQSAVSALVHAHRRKFKQSRFEPLDEDRRPLIMRMAVILRLAVLFHRDRGESILPAELSLSAKGDRLTLSFADGWLQEHPLTAADLEREQAYVDNCGFKLRFS
ncbi:MULTISPECIES: exopolyphosphatase [unclassified Guyparkeria]|uniref:exopolyphosphatase n=1 Tax=unclassified Guyparkeria TaxID=2626246 RepID=UPI0008253708|nr:MULTISPECIES: exopolyphosphatase [unclassified Guyparkeria]